MRLSDRPRNPGHDHLRCSGHAPSAAGCGFTWMAEQGLPVAVGKAIEVEVHLSSGRVVRGVLAQRPSSVTRLAAPGLSSRRGAPAFAARGGCRRGTSNLFHWQGREQGEGVVATGRQLVRARKKVTGRRTPELSRSLGPAARRILPTPPPRETRSDRHPRHANSTWPESRHRAGSCVG